MYPIKALRGIPLQTAQLGPQGIQYDRRIMLCRRTETGELKKIQLSRFPECALFEQAIVGDKIVIRYQVPEEPLVPSHRLQHEALEVPLDPDTASLEKVAVNLHNSPVWCYLMGDRYDAWFSACFGCDVVVVFIGDGKRKILGSMAPPASTNAQGWLAAVSSFVSGSKGQDEPWITFTDCAPFLVTTEASLRNVQQRSPGFSGLPMYKFRPNIVVDVEDEWSEDYWGEIVVGDARHRLVLTANCARCSSLNVDYNTGRAATGELGTVLKTLSRDRRVDKGNKWSPIFGRYGFLGENTELPLAVGDSVEVTKRLSERCVWDWPL